MPAEPAISSHPYAKTLVGEIIPPKKEIEPNKEDKPPKTQRFTEKEEGVITPIQRELATMANLMKQQSRKDKDKKDKR